MQREVKSWFQGKDSEGFRTEVYKFFNIELSNDVYKKNVRINLSHRAYDYAYDRGPPETEKLLCRSYFLCHNYLHM